MNRPHMAAICLVAAALLPVAAMAKPGNNNGKQDRQMSAMGALAVQVQDAVAAGVPVASALDHAACVNVPKCRKNGQDTTREPQDDDAVTPSPGGQAETSIAVDSTGQHIVIGYNDTRGFSSNPVSLSGVLYSDDGGKTFVDGGQLPSPGNEVIGGTKYPQVFGDPEVKYLGACTFIYSSIMVKTFPATPTTRTVQTLSVHRSIDCGHTWQGPFEVTAATNPNDQTNPTTGAPRDAADKEFMDVDPDTGRVIMSWSNFTPYAAGGVEIATTYSDNILAAVPTWSSRAIVAATDVDGQSSVPRFAGNGSNEAYVVWRRFPSYYGNNVGFARSTDNGKTWSAPLNLEASEFFTMDQVLGNDRVNTSPSIAVDNSVGPNRGNVYVVYANNDNGDGADIVLRKSTTGGTSFEKGLYVNSRPAADRAQWFPWVTVDKTSGRVSVFYYDQGIAVSGDLSEVSYTYSDDGGATWSPSLPLTDRPFHAGWGNDTGQPNLGDYNQAVAQGGELFAAYALASRPPKGYADGQPSASFTVPDVEFQRVPAARHKFKATTLDLQGVKFSDSGGNKYIDPNETVTLTPTLRNYVTNPLYADKVRGASVTLSTATPGVQVTQDFSPIDNLDPGNLAAPKKAFVLRTLPAFKAGTEIELVFSVRSAQHGDAVLKYTLFTGTPDATTILSQNFDGVAAPVLPTGWTASHGAGVPTVPWKTSSSFCGATSTNQAAFHANADDGTTSPTRWERLYSPLFTVPPDAEYVTIEMDVCYDTEEDPYFNVLAYDGFFLRVTDQTSGRTLRSVLVEAAEDEFTTGTAFHYPKHFPRSSNPAYFEDMSAWAGASGGWKRVRVRMPGMAGSTAQLRFEFTQDSGGICSDIRPGNACGVAVDNIVVSSVKSKPAQ